MDTKKKTKRKKKRASWPKRALRIFILTATATVLTAGVLYGIRDLEKRVTKEVEKDLAQQDTKFRESILSLMDQNKHGRFRETLRGMRMLEANSAKEQRRFWLHHMGEVYDHHTQNGSDSPELHYRMAMKHYAEALELAETSEERNVTFFKIGGLHLYKKEFLTASRYLNRLDRNKMAPEDVWQVDLWRAICNWEQGSHQKALDLANRVIDSSDDQKIWSTAVVYSADWMLEASQSDKLMELLARTKLTRVGPEELRKKAEEYYRMLILQTDTIDPVHGRAQLGLLRILLLKEKMSEAYEVANFIQTEVMPDDIKVSCLSEIATAEDRNGNAKKMLDALRYGHVHFPNYSQANPLTRRLYQKLVEAQKWEEAFAIAEGAVRVTRDPELVQQILHDFHPGKNRFFDKLDWDDKEQNYYSRVIDMFDRIDALDTQEWSEIAESSTFLRSAIPVAAKDYEEAQRSIALRLTNTTDPDFREWLLYLDLLSALRMGKPPAIRAIRAKRYIQDYPQGDYLGVSIATLMQAYYEMGLYDQAMETAKLMFIKEIVKLGEQEEPDPTQEPAEGSEWLNTVMKIAQCYYRNNQVNKANVIYRSYIDDILRQKMPDDVYVDWAKLSMAVDQNHEAIRRLDIIIPKIEDLFVLNQQRVARSVRGMQIDEPGALRDAKLLGEFIRQVEVLNEENFFKVPEDLAESKREEFTKQRKIEYEVQLAEVGKGKRLTRKQQIALLRELYEGMLMFSFDHHDRKGIDVNNLTKETFKLFDDRNWVEYWMLRRLSLQFDKQSISDVLAECTTSLEQLPKGSETFEYVKRQVALMANLMDAKEYRQALQNRGILK